MPKLTVDETLAHIVLNENIYVYKKKAIKFYSRGIVNDLFEEVKNDKDSMISAKLFSEINIKKQTKGKIDYRLSGLVFSYTHSPSFLVNPIPKWFEQKIAYLFILDFKEYVILIKRNIGGITHFVNSLNPLDYNVMSKLFVTDKTLFEKFSLTNLDISSKAMKAKSAESESLAENYNYIGSNTYVINHLRLNTGAEKYQLSLNSSRISKAGEKISIDNLGNWCYELIQSVRTFVDKETFLDNFATPCNYEALKPGLQPIVVTILLNRLLDQLFNGEIDEIYYSYETRRRNVILTKCIETMSRSIDLELDPTGKFYIPSERPLPSFLRGFTLNLNPKSIKINSPILKRVKLLNPDRVNDNLIDYVNEKNCVVVNFDDSDLVYSHRSLFRDSSLLGSIGYFLDIFHPHKDLVKITSEKGSPKSSDTAFQTGSVFQFVEKQFSSEQFLILDDLGDEWADHIALTNAGVTFIHSKYSKAQFSATAFTDIVGQTQKNLGNMFALESALEKKRAHWKKAFEIEKVKTKIQRLRKGASVDDFVEQYKKVKKNANPKRKVVLALNFMSKALLTKNLNLLKSGTPFAQRKQAIQILWYISSLIASCRDNNIEVMIYCKP